MPVSIVFLGLNDIGEEIYEWLMDRDDAQVFALLTDKEQLSLVKQLRPDLLISAGFRDIIPKEILDVPEKGAVNFHKAYLPYNRGANPNVWSIVEDNPAGVSIHYMTEEIDAGPIIDRREVEINPEDTAKDLYERLESEQLKQFKEIWDEIKTGDPEVIEQENEDATVHRKKDFVELWELDLEEEAKFGSFIDRLRALTFSPFKNAYFEKNGEKYYVEINITREKDNEKVERNIPTYED